MRNVHAVCRRYNYVGESVEGVNCRLEEWREVHDSKGLRIV